ncbi:MAG: hypothetical protein RR573_02980 [Oscillospiraceae bacterium]
MKKNKFFTFCFAFIPGCGQMYQGYMKRGLSIMLAFCAVIGVSVILNIGVICVLLPIIWAYSFFDTYNIRNYSDEQLFENPDKFMLDGINFNWKKLTVNGHKWLGISVLLLGIYLLYINLVRPLIYNVLINVFELYWLSDILRYIPTLAVAMLLIVLGVRLIKGEKRKTEEEIIEFNGVEK